MRFPAFLLIALALVAAPSFARAEAPSVIVLCYHNIEDQDPDQTYVGVSTAHFVEQMTWLSRNGYHPVSVDDLLAARDGRKPLPDQPVLLTFDDGYESFYSRAFPVLKSFGYPSVLAVVGSWMAGKPGDTVEYGDSRLPRSLFLTWDQVREVAASGLVEIASHSEESHRGIPANPQGNQEPAMVTRRWDATQGGYETEEQYRRRLNRDAKAISARIARETGRRPRVTVWPYGEHSELAIAIAAAHGSVITMSLVDAPASLDRLADMPRHLVNRDPDIDSFASEIRELGQTGPARVVQVDLDRVYDPDPRQQDRNVGALVQRIADFGVNTVYLQAFADPDGSGLARSVYFPNRHLPMRADLFNRVSWQLRTRARVRVFAWMPVLGFAFPEGAGQRVLAWDAGRGAASTNPNEYARLSPFDPEARRRILDVYEDLARSSPLDGLLFHDDALLSDTEDASPAALAAYAAAGFPPSIAAIRADPAARARWSRFKTDALIAFTRELADRVRRFRSPVMTARNIYARPLLEPESAEWFAQEYAPFLKAYDQVALMAMPDMENVPKDQARAWLRRLVAIAAGQPDGLKRTVFELQAVDWHGADGSTPIPTEELASDMRLLQRLGARSFGYYPDDVFGNHPDRAVLRKELSLQSHPYPTP